MVKRSLPALLSSAGLVCGVVAAAAVALELSGSMLLAVGAGAAVACFGLVVAAIIIATARYQYTPD